MPQPPERPLARARRRDQCDTAERDRAAEEEPAWEALAEERPGEKRDQDRTQADEHRCRAGVDLPLAGVQEEAVPGEPEEAADGNCREVAPRGERLSFDGDHQAEDDARDDHAQERERPRREVVSGGADPDKARSPQDERDARRRDRQRLGAGRGSSHCRGAHVGDNARRRRFVRSIRDPFGSIRSGVARPPGRRSAAGSPAG